MMARPRSKFYYDPEMAAFVKSCFEERLIYTAIRNKCIEKFGLERSPSTSALSRFYQLQPASSK
jgi:hypothetical protein